MVDYFEHNDNHLISVVVVDSGSGSTKVGLAHLRIVESADEVTHIPSEIIFNTALKIDLARDLEQHALVNEIIKSKLVQNLFTAENAPLAMCAYYADELVNINPLSAYFAPQSHSEAYVQLISAYGNKFSEAIKQSYINKITDLVKGLARADASHPTEVWLVGTAALRKADDGAFLVQALSHKINSELHYPTFFQIISQEEEGIRIFKVAALASNIPHNQLVSWDIGAASSQIVGEHMDGGYMMIKNTVASETYYSRLMTHLRAQGFKTEEQSFYPFSHADIETAHRLVAHDLQPSLEEGSQVVARLEDGSSTLVGVGSVHAAIMEYIKLNLAAEGSSYSKEQLKQAIHSLIGKSEDEVIDLIPDGAKPFARVAATNMLLVYATMAQLGVDRVEVVYGSNVSSVLQDAVLAKRSSGKTASPIIS